MASVGKKLTIEQISEGDLGPSDTPIRGSV
jgi:hypothetical protein